MERYEPLKIEQKWQKTWEKEKPFHAEIKKDQPQMFLAEMFPYPSGAGLHVGHVRNFTDVRALRAKALYDNDAKKTIRKSHENPAIKKLYEEFLGEPGSHKAHELLHTTYVKRTIN